jgi:lipoate-protein ligase A
LEELRATESYRTVHEALAKALRTQGVGADTKSIVDDQGEADETTLPGVCFNRAEIYDVIDEATGIKIAGAAQKRNKHGLLFQGSLWQPAITAPAFDWDRFENDFVAGLAAALGGEAQPTPWPELNDDEVSGLTEQYSSPEWIERR